MLGLKLTHRGRETHICVDEHANIGSDNGFMWTNAGILLIEPLGTNFNEILIEIHTFSIKKNAFENVVWGMATMLSRPQCVNPC